MMKQCFRAGAAGFWGHGKGSGMYEKNMTALAVSRAGHDCGKCYIVIGESENGLLLLVNGTTRPLDKPKQKKKKHVQLVVHLDEDLKAQIGRIGNDSDIRRILKAWAQR